MIVYGKIINIKSKKSILFLTLQNNDICQVVIKKENLDYYLSFLDVGDVVSCEVVRDMNNNGKYKTNHKSYLLKRLNILSKNVKNFAIPVNVENVIAYSNIRYEIRKYLHRIGYIEVSLPVLTDGEISSKAESFVTEYSKLKKRLYLRKTMDSFLRMYSCSGFNKIYSIGNCFRNEFLTSKYKPEFEMLSIFSNYISKNTAIKLSVKILKIITSRNIKIKSVTESEYKQENLEDDVFYVVSSYYDTNDSYCEQLYNKETNEFKIKFKNVTIVHGVSEIYNYEEYLKKINEQDRKNDYGELKVLEDLINSGASKCYNIGISIIRTLSLYNNLKIKDYDILSFDRLGGKK